MIIHAQKGVFSLQVNGVLVPLSASFCAAPPPPDTPRKPQMFQDTLSYDMDEATRKLFDDLLWQSYLDDVFTAVIRELKTRAACDLNLLYLLLNLRAWYEAGVAADEAAKRGWHES